MSYIQIFFVLIFIVSIFSSVVKNYIKAKSQAKNKTDKASINQPISAKNETSVLGRHAEWDKAAWGKNATKNKDGHQLPTWEKPKWVKSPEAQSKPTLANKTLIKSMQPMQLNFNDGFNKPETGFGFWLYLTGLAMLANTVSLIYWGYIDYEFFANLKPLMLDPRVAMDGWQDSEYAQPNPAYSWYINVTMAITILLIIGSIVIIYKFIEKSSEFPKLFVSLYIAMLAFAAIDALIYGYFEPNSEFMNSILLERDAPILISILLFVPYMLSSNRVKAVFVGH